MPTGIPIEPGGKIETIYLANIEETASQGG